VSDDTVKEEEFDPTGIAGFADLLNFFNRELDDKCQRRHFVGQEKYGSFTFLEKDMFEMVGEELADAINYLRYQYVKFKLLELVVAQDPRIQMLMNEEGELNLGIAGFFTAGERFGKQG
jgi:hypothetical protein